MKRVTVGLGPHHSLDFAIVPSRQIEQALWGLLCENSYCSGYLMCSWAQWWSNSRVEQAGPNRGTFRAEATLGRMHHKTASTTPGCAKSWICFSLPLTWGRLTCAPSRRSCWVPLPYQETASLKLHLLWHCQCEMEYSSCFCSGAPLDI